MYDRTKKINSPDKEEIMKKSTIRKILAAMVVMTLFIVALVIPTSADEPTEKVYVLDATADLAAFSQGAKADGDAEKAGTDNFFTVHYSSSTKIDGSNKSFDDGYSASQRINMGGKTVIGDPMKNAIEFTTDGPATLKVWWVSGGNDREINLYGADGTILQTSAVGSTKNELYITTIEIEQAGKYFLGSDAGSNYYFKVQVSVEAAPVETKYTLDTTADLTAMAAGTKAVGDADKVGTDGYFTLHYSDKTKIDSSPKSFEDGYSATQRLAMGGSSAYTGNVKNAISFTTEGPATVKVWWVCNGDGRTLDIANAAGTIILSSDAACIKNELYITTFTLEEAGMYFLGSNNYFFKVEVTVTTGGTPVKPPRADWSGVAAPVITSAEDDGEGAVAVTATGLVGYDGADELTVTVFDADGKMVDSKRSIAEKSEHSFSFSLPASGTYTFKATLGRENETAKESAEVNANFKYLLKAPNVSSVTSKGDGTLEVIFTSVKEAEYYEILVNGEVRETNVTETKVILHGFVAGDKVTVSVNAVRAEEKKASANSIEATVTAEAQQTWSFTAYGPSTDTKNNGYVGSVNEDGQVTVFSEGGKGKIQPNSQDGIAFYYTAVPTEYNFTLRATVTVDSWTISNGQEGFGLLATDRVGTYGDGADFWNNSYLVGSTKFEYRYESGEDGNDKIYNDHTRPEYASFPKYTMKLGLGVLERTGVNQDNLDSFQSNDTKTIQNQFKSNARTFESVCGYYGMEKGSYNIIGNYTGTTAPEGTLEDRFLLTTFVLEIQRNNTGYFATYYDMEGNIIAQEKFYDRDALSKIDSENIYVGFFASRNARATFTDITFETIAPEEDKPAEERPITYVQPSVTLSSPTVTTDKEYTIAVDTNVDGTLKITLNGKELVSGAEVKGNVRYFFDLVFDNYGENDLIITFTPDPNQDLGEYTQLSTTANQSVAATIHVNKGYYHNKVIYVAPDGTPKGNGTKNFPFDIYSAVDNVVEGQVIVLMEGTYKLTSPLKIQRGMDGTAELPIKMIADPEAQTRPVLDFQRMCAGIVHAGDYWYFYGFDVTNTADMQKGFQVSGNYNTLDNIHTYYNGNTGIQICRLSATDTEFADWPAYNYVLNCTSYCNYDAGFEDADGFAAKLTVGEGNVFDGCVAYNNADDGWDLYAKVETGEIGAVVIKNCVAYANGFIPGMDKTGNGNGFKLGGSSLAGQHQLINCYAFYNLAKGIDSNSCPDIIVENCISYNNGSYNVAFYTNVGEQTAFVANGIISFKDADLVNHVPTGDPTKGEQLKGKGTQKAGGTTESDYINATTYYWYGTECKNTAGTVLDAGIFKSLTFTGITRNADGTINMNGFLELTETAPTDAGARPAGTASADNSTLPEGDLHEYSDEWYTLDSEYHWHECECGVRSDPEAHDFIYVMDVEPTPTTSGWKHRECTVCGKKGTKIEVYYDEIAPSAPEGPSVDEPVDDAPAGFWQRLFTAIADFFGNIVAWFKGIF